jgi:polysaccharide chain length determinant protein (PEP-CTERM system associated)
MIFDFWFYLRLLLRRLPIMMLFILLASGLGIITALKLPDTYSTTARLLVEAPQIPDSMVSSVVQTDALEQLDIVEQRLLTRANLIDVANRFDVFEDLRGLEPDEVVQRMRDATSVRRSAGRDRATLLRISFEARSGVIAANVVNEYVTLVLEENVRFRRARTEGTLEFFEQEVQRLSRDVDSKSAAIVLFKAENAGALPENQSYRLGRQTLLQERLSRLERDMAGIQKQRRDILAVYETTGRVTSGTQRAQMTPNEVRLAEAQSNLEQVLLVYSKEHPRVTQLESQISTLEALVAEQSANTDLESESDLSPEQALLQSTLLEIDSRMAAIREETEVTKTELEDLRKAISQSASNGIELEKLERELEFIQASYDRDVNNLGGARMSERVETTAQGQRITVIESANVPRVPTGPDRPKIALAGVAVGLAGAGGYFILLEMLNRVIRRPSELTTRFNIIPISSIPYMESRRRRFVRRASIIFATLFVLISVPSLLWYIDTNYLPLEILVQKGLDKLGLG